MTPALCALGLPTGQVGGRAARPRRCPRPTARRTRALPTAQSHIHIHTHTHATQSTFPLPGVARHAQVGCSRPFLSSFPARTLTCM